MVDSTGYKIQYELIDVMKSTEVTQTHKKLRFKLPNLTMVQQTMY